MIGKWLAILLAIAAAGAGGWAAGHADGKAAGDRAMAALRADYVAKASKAKSDADAALASKQAEIDRVKADHDKTIALLADKSNRVIADLERGNLRLRTQWRGCEDRAALRPAGDPGQPDDAAKLRAAGAGDLVRVGASCDADITALQRALTAEREQ